MEALSAPVAPDALWQDLGLCAGVGPDLFFPAAQDIAGVRAAKSVCEPCPVRAQCLEFALDNDLRSGVWGGESEYARRKLRKARKADPRRPVTSGPPRRRDPTRPSPRRTPARRRSAA